MILASLKEQNDVMPVTLNAYLTTRLFNYFLMRGRFVLIDNEGVPEIMKSNYGI